MITFRNDVPVEFSDKFQVLMLQVVNFDISTLNGEIADKKIDLIGEEDRAE
ncbi:MAG: hypothetical protein NWP47_00675 [Rickettsiaceae bacterium]|jgi:hypothetical protein|nr:hypothetical protein [Rickettsiaceae bacterium]